MWLAPPQSRHSEALCIHSPIAASRSAERFKRFKHSRLPLKTAYQGQESIEKKSDYDNTMHC